MVNPVEWLLCIDESGDFKTPADRVCAGGLLLQEADSPALTSRLQARLSFIFPHLPYPPHAVDYNHPSLHLPVWRHLSSESREAVPPELRGGLERAEQLLLAVQGVPPELLNPLPPGLPPPAHSVLSSRDRWLRFNAPQSHDALQSAIMAMRLRMTELLRELVQLYPQKCLLAAAAEPAGVPALPTNGDRYLGLLRNLFIRVIQLLRARQEPVRLTLRVASRLVRRSSKMSPLQQADVALVFEEALRASGTGVQVHPVISQPEDYNAQVHPAIVLSDYVLNRARVLLGASTWGVLARGVVNATGLPVELSIPGSRGTLPAITAEEAAPGWVPEQEKQWLSHLAVPQRMRVVE